MMSSVKDSVISQTDNVVYDQRDQDNEL